MPIETLTNRESCKDYLVSHEGTPRLLWWVKEDREWIGPFEVEGSIPESEVKFWFDLHRPPDSP